MHVYKWFRDAGVWTVGFYDPLGNWEPVADFTTEEQAAERVHYLNGGKEIA